MIFAFSALQADKDRATPVPGLCDDQRSSQELNSRVGFSRPLNYEYMFTLHS